MNKPVIQEPYMCEYHGTAYSKYKLTKDCMFSSDYLLIN